MLDAAAEAAEEAGTWVLRAAGVEFEADLTYSGLHQVLLPLLGSSSSWAPRTGTH